MILALLLTASVSCVATMPEGFEPVGKVWCDVGAFEKVELVEIEKDKIYDFNLHLNAGAYERFQANNGTIVAMFRGIVGRMGMKGVAVNQRVWYNGEVLYYCVPNFELRKTQCELGDIPVVQG